MTQDQPGQAHGAGYDSRGEPVPDDETEAPRAEQPGPVTRLKKAASALRGDKPDQTVPDESIRGQTVTGPGTPEPNGSWPAHQAGEAAMNSTVPQGEMADPEYADGTGAATGSGPGGRHAAMAEDAGFRPGEATERLGDFGDIAFGNLFPDADRYTRQWEQIQFRFVDDPQGSVTEAADVISQVTARLEAAIRERQRAIQERASALRGRWGEGSNADTETLRETLRMYRALMDQLSGPANQS
jgi:hypothetical protein